jgi:hypothetical protein
MPEHVHVLVYPTRSAYDIRDIRQEIKEPVGRKAVDYLRRSAPLSTFTITRCAVAW